MPFEPALPLPSICSFGGVNRLSEPSACAGEFGASVLEADRVTRRLVIFSGEQGIAWLGQAHPWGRTHYALRCKKIPHS